MAASARTLKLNKYLETVLSGKSTVSNAAQSKQFIEAICAQPDPATCIDRLIAAGKRGLDAIQAALRTDLTLAFLDGHASSLLAYLQAPEIKSISGGSYLHKILKAIVDPPIFWNVLIDEFKAKHLSLPAQQCFGWVLLQLILVPSDTVSPSHLSLAEDVLQLLLSSKHLEVRGIGSQIKNTLSILSSPHIAATQEAHPPGGRHDNDFADFRKISVLPTAQEVASTTAPFLRTSDAIDDPSTEHLREAIYLDSQFRLIREDMISELRDEVQIALGKQKGKKHRGFNVKGMQLVGVDTGSAERRTKWGLVFEFLEDLPQLKELTTPESRKAFFAKKDGSKIFKDQSLTCLLVDGEVVAFPSIRRDESLLSQKPPQIVLTLGAEASVKFILLKAQSTNDFHLLHMNTAVFSFEPILLTLKRMKKLPLVEEILFWKNGKDVSMLSPPPFLASRISRLSAKPKQNIGALLGLQKNIVLDEAQAKSLLSGLTQKLSIIQGPPGTGKSFIGALLAKFICDFSDQIILVVCYTNHALDQFLEDLLDVGIPEDTMVRLGGKSTSRTLPMLLRNQARPYGFSRGDHTLIDQLKRDAETRARGLETLIDQFISSSVRNEELWMHLEFEAPDFFDAFQIPVSDDGMRRVGEKGKEVKKYDLLKRWRAGQDAGTFSKEPNVRAAQAVWRLKKDERKALEERWTLEIKMEQIDLVYDGAKRYGATQDELAAKFRERDIALLQGKRVIGCTTTAAAKYASDIQKAGPQVVLVEEAAEILESHVITALGPSTEQLVLIGDHKQLRPKVNNYNLTVEKGDGYDLNCSLFERLVVKGYPHHTLVAQHRMRPEISGLVRALTYPDLVDAPNTKNRDDIKGLQDNIIFINHAHPEDNIAAIADKRDLGSNSSKQNTFEAQMVLKVVRYLAQQGYGTRDMVVLTPYLGQLQKLREQLQLQGEIDPVLNDLDSFELVQAGLLQSGAARAGKNQLRLATIDNYQGEESDIIIGSLTRSNTANDIGFMFSPERVNVLLSRARNGLILIGNSHTFTHARKGRELWTKLVTMLNHDGHVYDGLPVMCQQHPDRVAIIKTVAQFDVDCPDGGCSESCGIQLSCGRHVCPSKCHRLDDHSKMPCQTVIPGRCVKGHDQSRKCSDPIPKSCKECDRKAKLEAARLQKELERQRKKDEEEAEHLRKMKEIDEKLAEQQELLRDAQRKKDQENEIRLKMEDLENAKAAAERARQVKTGSSNGPAQSSPSSGAAAMPTPGGGTPAPPQPPSSTTTPQNANPSDSSSQSHSIQPNTPSPDTPSPLSPEQRRPSIYTSVPTITELSPAEQDWEYRKRTQGVLNPPLDSIMGMVGLESVKKQLLAILDKIDTAKRQNASLKDERFNITFLGNPGTGKTTVARQYGKFLSVVDALSGTLFKEVTGASLAHDGVGGAKQLVADVLNAGGGTIFIDEAYQLTSSGGRHSTSAPTGGPVLDFLLAEMENHRGKIIFIFAGYNKQMETFFEHNPGIPSRVPNSLQFEDYTDMELLKILESRIHARYDGKMKVEDGIKGLYGRITVRRLGRGRGKEGFGNARALENLFSTITTRQAARLTAERRAGRAADDFLFIREDIIGLEPSPSLLDQCDAWKELHALIGLTAVKESVEMLVDRIQINYQRDLQEQEPLDMSLNRVFLGSPGTGKTSVAKLYGQILARLGLLSNGEVVVKNPSDFIGQYIGQSEAKTKAILETTKGKVLVIDEAYGLYGGDKSGSNTGAFKASVIDTIVAEVQGDPRDDRCVLLLGYKDQMIEMFQNVNQGLSRRFAIEQAFNFDDFSSAELLQILELKLKKQTLLASPDGKKVAIERLEREKRRANFGNGGAVDNLLSAAKANAIRRLKGQKVPTMMTLEAEDFDPDYNRASNASDNLTEMFKDVVGCDAVVAKLRGYQQVALTKRNRGEDPTDLIPTNFVFKGPPGTGKTTTARKMGQVYYDMGFLAKPDVTECSASDLVGQYVGQTGPKTGKVFEAALGQVLFIDEAYRLKNGHFAQEAVDEMVDLLTQDKYKGKIVVILAGYDQDINELLSVNRGLSSRFPEEIIFTNLSMEQCMQVLQKELRKSGIVLRDIESSSSAFYIDMADLMMDLSQLPSWGNARDVITLAKKLVALAYQQNRPNLELSSEDAMKCAVDMYTERCSRASNISPAPRRQRTYAPPPMATDDASASASSANSSAAGNSKEPPPPPPPRIDTPPPPPSRKDPPPPPPSRKATPPPPTPDENKDEPKIAVSKDGRDPGVSDQIWNQLQADKKKAEDAVKALEASVRTAEKHKADAARGEQNARKAANKHASDMAKATDAANKDRLKKLKEAAQRKEANAKKERERQEAELKRRRERLEKQRKEEVRVQTRLREMGRCVQGFAWIKQQSGYICAGGMHFVSNAQLGI